jgi:tetratricopeptide (TPR) repeat protein
MRHYRRLLICLILIVAAFAFRLSYYEEYQHLPEFTRPTVDALFHHQSAIAIAGGALTAPTPFFRAPFYNYFLGLIYFLSGDSVASARFLQLLMGCFTPLLVFLLAGRLFDERTGLIAAILTLFCGDLVYFEGELLLEFLMVTEILLVWLCFLRFQRTRFWYWAGLSGILTGIAMITRPNAIVLGLVLLYLLYREYRDRVITIGRLLLTFMLPLLLPVILVLAHNLTRQQPAFTIATQGGINFYLGNNSAADGVSAVMPGKLGYSWQYEDIAYLADKAEGKKLTPTEVSSFYYRKGLSDILHRPLHWIGLLVRKTYLFFSGFSISNNRNLITFKSQFLTLKFLPIGMWLLGPLGLVGIVLSYRRSRTIGAVAAFVVLYALSFVLFFVNSRFRLPLLPILAMFSGYTVIQASEFVRAHRWRKVIAAGSGVIALLLLFNLNIYRLNFNNRQQVAFSRGNLDMQLGDTKDAIAKYRESLQGSRPLRQSYLNLGVAYLRAGHSDSAQRYFELEDSVFGGSADALSNLSYLAREEGNLPVAVAYAKEALIEKPYLVSARLNLWHAWRQMGFSDSAYAAIAEAARQGNLTQQEEFLLAVTALDLGLPRAAIATLEEILARNHVVSQPSYSSQSTSPDLIGGTGDESFRAKVLYNLGTAFGMDHRIDSALIYLTESVRADSTLAEAWTNLGTAYLSRAQYERAIESLQKASALGVNSGIVYYDLALAYLALADTTQALANLQKALERSDSRRQAEALNHVLQKKAGDD